MLTTQTPTSIRRIVEFLVVVVLYYASAKLGQVLSIPPGNVTPVWPPSGIALAALLLIGNRAAVPVGVAAFLANTNFYDVSNLTSVIQFVATGFPIAAGSALQPFVGAYLIRRNTDSVDVFGNVTDFLKFCAVVPVMCLVSASFGSPTLWMAGLISLDALPELWTTWWLGDSVGVFVTGTLLLSWLRQNEQKPGRRYGVECGLILVPTVFVSLFAFTHFFGSATAGYPLEFAPIPFLLWAGLRLGLRGTTAVIFVVEVIAIYGTHQGQSPFAVGTLNHSLMLLQLFVTITTIAALIVAVFVNQSETAERALEEARDRLDLRVKERTEELQKAIVVAEEARSSAESANLAKSKFLANVSHEIRTPMNAILGFTDILHSQLENAQQKSYLASIQSSGKTLFTLINDILDLSRVESGGLELDYDVVDAGRIFREVEGMFAQEALEKGLTLRMEVDPELPEAVVLDGGRLLQILSNLVSNAIKFTESGHVTVSVRSPKSGDNSVDLNFDIRDTGIGIPEDQQERIFGKFMQCEGQSINEYGGIGLGLAMTKHLVDLMNGEISLSSEVDMGSTFQVILRDVEIASAEGLELQPGTAVEVDNIAFDQATVLVADDVADNRELIRGFLSPYGFEVLEAENGAEAIEVVKRKRPDLVLMDIKMPVLDGFKAIQMIRADSSLKETRIVALTASTMRESEAEISAACNGFLRKPIEKDELVRALTRFLKYTMVEHSEAEDYDPSGPDLVEPDEMDSDAVGKLPALVDYLNDQKPRWEALQSTLTINEVEEFAEDMANQGTTYGYAPLVRWANQLHHHVTMFEMDELAESMKRFPEVLSEMVAISSAHS
jgi:signal transduction histidine kinase/CheY-like chemotaxis protein